MNAASRFTAALCVWTLVSQPVSAQSAPVGPDERAGPAAPAPDPRAGRAVRKPLIREAPALDDGVPLPVRRVVLPGPDRDEVVQPASGDPFFLASAAGSYAPPESERIDPALGDVFARYVTDGRPRDEVFAFVMFKRRITKERIEQLESMGVRVIGFYPHHALHVALPPARVPDVAFHDAVRWVGLLRPWQKVHPALLGALSSSGDEPVPVFVSVSDDDLCERSESTVIARPVVSGPGRPPAPDPAGRPVRSWQSRGWQQGDLERAGVQIVEYLPRIRTFRARLKAAQLAEVAARDYVLFVEPDLPAETQHEESTPMISSDRVRASFDGSNGAIVGILDSGFAPHEMLDHVNYVGWDLTGNATVWADNNCNHGTHVAGTILGEPPGEIAGLRGNAPGLGTSASAWVRVVRMIDLNPAPPPGAAPACVTFGSVAAALGPMTGDYVSSAGTVSPAPHVVNNSWGTRPNLTPAGAPLSWIGTEANCRTIDAFVFDNDQVLVFAAGNYGNLGAGSLSREASAKNALAVGNVVDYADPIVGDPGALWISSSRGPCGDGRWKPNVVAPGRWIESASSTGANAYLAQSGTSMAAPHVTGVVAQLVDRYEGLRYAPATIASLVMATATTPNDQIVTTPAAPQLDNVGVGRVDSFRANEHTDQFESTAWGCELDVGQMCEATFEVAPGATRLVVCLHYVEDAPAAGAGQALVNDFDLFIDASPLADDPTNADYSAHQSSLDNTEIRFIEDPSPGKWRWSVVPDVAVSNVKVGVTVHVVYGDTTPDVTLDLIASPEYVKPNEEVEIIASVTNPSFVASAVFLDSNVTVGAGFSLPPDELAATTTLADGAVTDLADNQADGLDVLLGNIVHGESRSVTWTARFLNEGIRLWSVEARSDNIEGSVTKDVLIYVDGTAPSKVITLFSPTHPFPGQWYNKEQITFAWAEPFDLIAGVDGYSISVTSGAEGTPPPKKQYGKDVLSVTKLFPSLASDGAGYYFNIRAVDAAGNWGPSSSIGPYLIDTIPPQGVFNLAGVTAEPWKWSANPYITVQWTSAVDAQSGLYGYRTEWTEGLTSISLDGVVDQSASATSVSAYLSDSGEGWYFHIRPKDVAGNWGETMHVGPFLIDTAAPAGPSTVGSTTHEVSTWSNEPSISVEWTPATDSLSGLAGYRTHWSETPMSILPAGSLDQDASATSSITQLSDTDKGWHFHIRARDQAGNWGETMHLGPFLIDTAAPAGPSTVGSTTHEVSTWSNDPSITVEWTPATDSLSGLAGYRTKWLKGVPSIGLFGALDKDSAATSVTSELSDSGEGWYFHIRARDEAGNWGETAHLGPFFIDTVPPEGIAHLTSTTHTVGGYSEETTITVKWSPAHDSLSGLEGYATRFDTFPATELLGPVDTEPGETQETLTLPPSTDGWYFHIRARDQAGNWGETRHLGPFFITGGCSVEAIALEYGQGKAGTLGVPTLEAVGEPVVGAVSGIQIANALPGAKLLLLLGTQKAAQPWDGGMLWVSPQHVILLPQPVPSDGVVTLKHSVGPTMCGKTLYYQVVFSDPGATVGHSAQTNGLMRTFGMP